jgi:hypothetical protein
MGVGRPFRRIDLRHANGDLARLDLLPELIELLELLCIGAHKGCCESDVPLRDALESADGREGAAVANGGDDKFVEHRSVREPIDPLREMSANPRRDIIAPPNDDIGAKRRNQLFVLLGSIGDDRQPLGFGELNDIAAISARCAVTAMT